MKCTDYIAEDHEWWEHRGPCHCPVCGGFLKWVNWPEAQTPECNKCGTELIALPEIDEDTGEELEFGKICQISLPQSSAETARGMNK